VGYTSDVPYSNEPEPIALSWSGGKDSSYALYRIIKEGRYKVAFLITTITKDFNRISMHGIRRELLNMQADSLGIPILPVEISYKAGNAEYESKMKEVLESLQSKGINRVAFGDIYLEDIRKYREEKMSQIGMSCIFPIWGCDPLKLAGEIVNAGFKATICTLDPSKLSRDFIGNEYNMELIQSLPPSVDPCGERGEFHTFAYGGPIYRKPVRFRTGETVERDSFLFIDLIPA
jgi:uncharacterized protein (TIGR00290 family)